MSVNVKGKDTQTHAHTDAHRQKRWWRKKTREVSTAGGSVTSFALFSLLFIDQKSDVGCGLVHLFACELPNPSVDMQAERPWRGVYKVRSNQLSITAHTHRHVTQINRTQTISHVENLVREQYMFFFRKSDLYYRVNNTRTPRWSKQSNPSVRTSYSLPQGLLVYYFNHEKISKIAINMSLTNKENELVGHNVACVDPSTGASSQKDALTLDAFEIGKPLGRGKYGT